MSGHFTMDDREVGPPKGLQVLIDASAMLLATSDQDAVLTGILDLASKLLAADAYAVWRDCEGDGRWRAVATRGLSKTYRTIIEGAASAPTAIRAIENIAADPSLKRFRDVYAAEGIRSLLVAPMPLGPGQAGTITFYWRQNHRTTRADRDYTSALANLSAAALKTTELHDQNQREKQRLSFLAEASTVLASSLDYETTLNQVAQLAVPHIADWCSIHILEDGRFNRLVVAHADPAMLSVAEDYTRRYPEEIREDRGLGAVLRTGSSEIYPHITDEMMVGAARDQEHLRLLRSLKISSSILTPLISRGKVLGAIRLLAAGEERHFNQDDVQLAEDLARRAASAMENAQLHRAVLKQESELRLAHSAARMGSWSWSWDNEHLRVFWSPEFKALHGLPADAEPGYEARIMLAHPDDRERIQRELEEVFASKAEQITSEHRAVTADGRVLWIHSRGSIQRDANGKPMAIVGISMDVTESRLAENALRRTEKLAAAGRLAANVAHEVNNPLEALMNLVYLTSKVTGLPAEARSYLETAEGELRRMAHIVRQTLGFYRESVHPHPTDIAEVMKEVIRLYASRATARSVELAHSADPGMMAFANAGEIRQVLANLISNAIDASPAGASVNASVKRSENKIEITIEDSGTGISESNLAHLFEPFFTTKPDIGTGLGLWVAKGIVEKHHGSITISSETAAGRSGTVATVFLPALEVEEWGRIKN